MPGLWDKLRLIAAEVRGGTTREGPFDNISYRDLRAAWRIAQMNKDGLDRNEIHKELRNEGYTLSDVHRLGNLRPVRPERELPD